MFEIVDHIGFAVKDVEQSIDVYTKNFGITEWERIEMPDRHMKMGVARLGDTLLELIQPTSDDAAVAKFIKDKGPGVHHIAYRVDDIRVAMQELQEKGVRMLDKEPRPGIHNTLIAFVHPRTGDQGVLVELVQHQGHH